MFVNVKRIFIVRISRKESKDKLTPLTGGCCMKTYKVTFNIKLTTK